MEGFPGRRLTWCLFALGAVATAATLALFVAMATSNPSALVWVSPFAGAFVAGVVAVRRRPDHVAARRLLVFGTAATVFIGCTVGVVEAFEQYGPGRWLGPADVAVRVAGLSMEATMIAMAAVYPDGRYHRRYERWIVRVAASLVLVLPLALLLSAPALHPSWGFAWGETTTFPRIDSPLHVPAFSFAAPAARVGVDAALAGGPLIAGLLVWRRYRRIEPAERRQIRWPVYGVLLLLLAPLAAVLHELGFLSLAARDVVVLLALLVLPVSTAIGLVRPDLFDVDRAARGTLLYVPLWIAIAGAYVGTAAALGLAASDLGLPAAVGVTIMAAVLFEPLRRRSARRAAGWAYGTAFGGEKAGVWLGQALDQTLDLTEVAASIAATAAEGLGVRWVAIGIDGIPTVVHGVRPAGDRPAMTAPLARGGERFGEIECGRRHRGGLNATDEAELATLARQAALTIHNARLAADLSRTLAELKRQSAEIAASRTRIVEAEEAARRRIERDIHDGAQQELIGLIAQIGLARNQLGNGVDGADVTLARLQDGVRSVAEQLRRLAHGIHPTELADHGLVEAIEGRCARLPVRVRVECEPGLRTTRFDDRIEGAAYFFVSEGLANVLKHADATSARVCLAHRDGHLEVEVSDSGRGFAASGMSTPGLRGLADRMEALGGEVRIESAPGRGTRLRARLPVGIRAGAATP